jgi:hypothetical protein
MNPSRPRRLCGRGFGQAAVILLLTAFLPAAPLQNIAAGPGISKAAADSCAAKVKELSDHAANRTPGKQKTTRFSVDEINSYLAFYLSPSYNPCLKNLVVSFGEDQFGGSAVVDFDKLGETSKKSWGVLVAGMLSGVHNLAVQGRLVTAAGKGSFELQRASFDGMSLPNFLVTEIISAVGRKQKPPFDPMKPSQMPFAIEKVEVHQGYIVVYQ